MLLKDAATARQLRLLLSPRAAAAALPTTFVSLTLTCTLAAGNSTHPYSARMILQPAYQHSHPPPIHHLL